MTCVYTCVSCMKDLQVSLLADRISQCIDSWTPPAIRGRDVVASLIEALQWHILNRTKLGGGFKYFLFSPLLGEMINFD